MFRRTQSLLNSVRCCTFLRTKKQAVIKMFIKDRSPTMTHVSSTHRVVLDRLFDRINVDPKIQIKCVDAKHHFAGILTKGKFTAMSGTIFFICSTSAISAYSAALRILA